jgi:phosphoadenosine phosphosulfate reductase
MTLLSERRSQTTALSRCNATLGGKTATDRVAWALRTLPSRAVVTSSFGAQSAAMLHLMTQARPDIPVIFIDTGYLFPETYRFVDELTDRLRLNLIVFRAEVSPAWQEARYGKRWEQGLEGINAYDEENKVAPMQRALAELDVGTWFAGVRRTQSETRAQTPFIAQSGGRWKVHPIADWTDRDIYQYLKRHDLPYHPLWEKGFVSIGDVHTTQSLSEAGDITGTRYGGLKRECGLHLMDFGNTGDPEPALASSG